ncbi:MAG: transglutaminase domain-containing protein [Nitrospirota bacterium]
MNPLRISLLTVLLILLLVPATEAGLIVLEGEHTVVYDIVNPRGVAFIPNYSNESFEQKVVILDEFSKRVTVTSRMSPLKTRVQFPIQSASISSSLAQYLAPEKDRQSQHPSIVRLASEITRGSGYAHEAVNSILSWIADTLTFDASLTVPADAVSALKYKKAYCVGYSNLAVALIRAAGIPARVAHGYLPPGYEWGFSKEYWGVKVNDGGFHAYLEVYYPDLGWTFSDAEHSHNFVDPFHIILRVDGETMPGYYSGGYLDVDKATFYTIVENKDKTRMADILPVPKIKRLGRRMDDRQYAAIVTGKVTDTSGNFVPEGTVVVWKDGKGTPNSFANGTYSVAVSDSGKHRIELKGKGFSKSSREIQIEKGRTYRFDTALNPGGVIFGNVRDASGKPVDDGDVFYREGTVSYGISIDKGSYRIEGLAPGSYKVSVLRNDREVSSGTVDVHSGKEMRLDFVVK